MLSIAFARDEPARKMEPYASRPSNRFEVMKRLAEAGVRVGILVAPIIPGLNDSDIPELLERARDAGRAPGGDDAAAAAGGGAPRVRCAARGGNFRSARRRCANALPGDARRQDERGAFGARFEGKGARWQAIERLFDLHVRRLGMEAGERVPVAEGETTFRRPTVQGELFER